MLCRLHARNFRGRPTSDRSEIIIFITVITIIVPRTMPTQIVIIYRRRNSSIIAPGAPAQLWPDNSDVVVTNNVSWPYCAVVQRTRTRPIVAVVAAVGRGSVPRGRTSGRREFNETPGPAAAPDVSRAVSVGRPAARPTQYEYNFECQYNSKFPTNIT